MASDILVGVLVGVIILGFANPLKGIIWVMLEQRRQIAFLSGQKKGEKK